MRWDRAELSNYNKAHRSLKMVVDDFRRVFFPLTFFPTSDSYEGRRPLGTPFMIVSAQRFVPNQYGISR